MEKQIAFYLTNKSSKQLDEIQKIISEHEGKVTKAYIMNQAIYKYYDFIKELYGDEEQ